jgi:hypothetical protein
MQIRVGNKEVRDKKGDIEGKRQRGGDKGGGTGGERHKHEHKHEMNIVCDHVSRPKNKHR